MHQNHQPSTPQSRRPTQQARKPGSSGPRLARRPACCRRQHHPKRAAAALGAFVRPCRARDAPAAAASQVAPPSLHIQAGHLGPLTTIHHALARVNFLDTRPLLPRAHTACALPGVCTAGGTSHPGRCWGEAAHSLLDTAADAHALHSTAQQPACGQRVVAGWARAYNSTRHTLGCRPKAASLPRHSVSAARHAA